jgi:hypothetical protein
MSITLKRKTSKRETSNLISKIPPWKTYKKLGKET